MAWVFAYGSLMGDAVLGRYRARPARLPGYRRAFLHESRRRWGTPESPCPILGLAPGDECWGLAFEIPDADRRSGAARAIEKREAAGERRRGDPHGRDRPTGPVDAWVWVSRNVATAADRPRGGRGAPARRPRRRGNGRRVRADARPRAWSRTASATRSSTRSGRGCGAERSHAALHHRRGRLRERHPKRRGPRPLHTIPATLAGLVDLGLRHHVRAAAMTWWADGALDAGARLEARPARHPARPLRPRAARARAGRARGRHGTARLAVAGGRLRGHGLRRACRSASSTTCPTTRVGLRLRRGRAAGGLRDGRRERRAADATATGGPTRGRDRRGRGAAPRRRACAAPRPGHGPGGRPRHARARPGLPRATRARCAPESAGALARRTARRRPPHPPGGHGDDGAAAPRAPRARGRRRLRRRPARDAAQAPGAGGVRGRRAHHDGAGAGGTSRPRTSPSCGRTRLLASEAWLAAACDGRGPRWPAGLDRRRARRRVQEALGGGCAGSRRRGAVRARPSAPSPRRASPLDVGDEARGRAGFRELGGAPATRLGTRERQDDADATAGRRPRLAGLPVREHPPGRGAVGEPAAGRRARCRSPTSGRRPPLGYPRETDSLCPRCVIETRKQILSGERDLSDLVNGHLGRDPGHLLPEGPRALGDQDLPRPRDLRRPALDRHRVRPRRSSAATRDATSARSGTRSSTATAPRPSATAGARC